MVLLQCLHKSFPAKNNKFDSLHCWTNVLEISVQRQQSSLLDKCPGDLGPAAMPGPRKNLPFYNSCSNLLKNFSTRLLWHGTYKKFKPCKHKLAQHSDWQSILITFTSKMRET
mmetsp:Transcript_136836/g.237845  ORF Transcript_136836/g.237845 Transcript_136836/m.237845 type:complete len:113 (+) Transcript_136836:269-607(+)